MSVLWSHQDRLMGNVNYQWFKLECKIIYIYFLFPLILSGKILALLFVCILLLTRGSVWQSKHYHVIIMIMISENITINISLASVQYNICLDPALLQGGETFNEWTNRNSNSGSTFIFYWTNLYLPDIYDIDSQILSSVLFPILALLPETCPNLPPM